MFLHDISNSRLFAIGNDNWDYYIDKPWSDKPDKYAIWYIAKEEGCDSGYMGDISHIKKLLRQGHFNHEITEFGKSVLRIA